MDTEGGMEPDRRMAGRISSPIFVGRTAELSALATALERAIEGSASTVLIAGEAGVGKTRLVEEFEEHARRAGARILRGSCLELGGGGIPFAPFAEALRELWRETGSAVLVPLLGPARSELGRLVPEIASPEDPTAVTSASVSSSGRLFELTLGFLDRLSANAPVALVVEDLHWSDAATRDLLVFLVRNARRQRLLIVATFRSDALHRRHPLAPIIAELERVDRVDRVGLNPFDRDEIRMMLTGILGRRPDSRLEGSIVGRSGGNAFFAEELAAASALGVGLPQGLRDLILVRVEAVAEPTQTMLRAAAVLGPRFDESTLSDVAGFTNGELNEALRDAVTHHLIEPIDEAIAPAYRFRHALVQEAIHLDQLPGERARLHAACARALSVRRVGAVEGPLDAARAAEIAHHWDAARDQPRALAAAVVAGNAALGVYAFGDALGHFESALTLWDQVGDADALTATNRGALLMGAADAAWLAGDGRRAVGLIRSAIELADGSGDPAGTGHLRERLGQYLWDAGDETGAADAYEAAARLIPETPASEARARVLATQGQMLMLNGRFGDSAETCRQAIDLAREIGSAAVEGHARCTLGVAQAYTGRIDEGLLELAEARRLAEHPVRPDDLGRAMLNLGLVLWRAGRLDESTTVSLEGRDAARRLGLERTLGRSLATNAAITLFYQGRWDEAAAITSGALDEDTQGLIRIHLLLTRAQIAIGRGDWAPARVDLDEVAGLVEPVSHAQLVGDLHALRAEHAVWRGELDEASTAVESGLRLLGTTGDVILRARLSALGLRAAADRAELGNARRLEQEVRLAREAGSGLLAGIEPIASDDTFGASFDDRQPAAYLALSRAEASRLDGSSDPEAWAAAAEAWASLNVPFPFAYARWREAEARLGQRSGARSDAEVPLRAARDAADRLGAAPLRKEIIALARRARLELDVAEPVAPEPRHPPEVERLGLTERELEVLSLVAVGRTNRQIGEALFITEKTAGAHVSNILGKLGIAGRVEAAGIALRLGLVDDRVTRSE